MNSKTRSLHNSGGLLSDGKCNVALYRYAGRSQATYLLWLLKCDRRIDMKNVTVDAQWIKTNSRQKAQRPNKSDVCR